MDMLSINIQVSKQCSLGAKGPKMCQENTGDMVKREKKSREQIKTTIVKQNGLINTFRKNFIACHYSLLACSNSCLLH